MKNCLILSFTALIYSCISFAQEALPFNIQKEFYIYGNAQAIGNNIISKYDKKAFNDTSFTNDDVDMVFVDVDEDPETFNSSSATLELPENRKKIVYAALYWTATYCYKQGYREDSGDDQFVFRGRRVYEREDINKVKLKLPNGSYKNITGTLLFDGEMSNDFTLNSPYLCYADVTRFLKNKRALNGEYTIANVNATKGFVSGGGAAGWMLYVVYEAPTSKPNYITTFNGFALSNEQPIKVKFENFKSAEQGDVKTSLTFAALEGDAPLKGDQCILFNPISQKGAVLYTDNRPKNNFFNSKITNNNSVVKNRYPNSNNTLGFDLVAMSLTHDNQQIIDNNTSEVEMVFNTESDRFYLFFTAFQTEISKLFYDEMKGLENEALSSSDDQEILVENSAKKSKNKSKFSSKKQNTKKEQTYSNRKRGVLVIESGKPNRILSYKKEEEKKPVKTAKIKKERQSIKKSKTARQRMLSSRKRNVMVIESGKPNKIIKQADNTIVAVKKEKEATTKTKEKLNKQKAIVDTKEKPNKKAKLVGKTLPKEGFYLYEAKINNPNVEYIKRINKGYYIIGGVYYDLDSALSDQKDLLNNSINSKIFKDTGQEKFYIYLYNSEKFYDVFIMKESLVKNDLFKKIWILNINMKDRLLKQI